MRVQADKRAVWRPLLLGGAAVLWLVAAGKAWGVTDTGAAPSCEHLAAQAAARHGLPPGLIKAVALTETGRTVDGQYRAWPWAINVAGQGHYPDSKAEALARLHELRARDMRSFDVGCMQINYRWHGQEFDSLEAMLDPATNTDYAARYLAQLQKREGSWDAAIRRYHSSDRDRGASYLARVRSHMDRIARAGQAQTAVTPQPKAATPMARVALIGRGTIPRDRRFSTQAPLVRLAPADVDQTPGSTRLPEGRLPKRIDPEGHGMRLGRTTASGARLDRLR